MIRPVDIATRPQVALQSYLDALLQDVTDEVLVAPEPPSDFDEFKAAVLEEQVRDARMAPKPLAVATRVALASPVQAPVAAPVVTPVATPTLTPVAAPLQVPVDTALELPVALKPAVVPPVQAPVQALAPVEPIVELNTQHGQPPLPPTHDGRPEWAAEPFECLLFDVAGLTLAVPLVCLGAIYTLEGQELTPLFGQPDWFLGILTCQAGNLKVLDTARWVMPDRYRDDFRQGLQYVISVQGYEWGLAVHQVSRSLRLDPDEIKWRAQRGHRPWLAGTVIEHMCALLDVAQLAELIASGAVKKMNTLR